MVEQHMDLLDWYVMRGTEGMVPATYQAIAYMRFKDQQTWEASFAETSPKLLADIPEYTDATPIIQVSEIISSV